MKQIPRHQQIVDLVKTQGYASTDELVEKFDVSPQTIRRDLNELADSNKIRRYHGGATIPLSSENTSYNTRKTLNFNEKDVIADEVVKHIQMAPLCSLILVLHRKPSLVPSIRTINSCVL